jgi:hypothetical protein
MMRYNTMVCYGILEVSRVSFRTPFRRYRCAYLPISHSLTPPFLTYSTSNNPPPSPGPKAVTLALSSFSFLLSAFRLDRSASVSQSSSYPLIALLDLFSAFSSSFNVGEGERRNLIFGISMGSSYKPGDLFRGYHQLSPLRHTKDEDKPSFHVL